MATTNASLGDLRTWTHHVITLNWKLALCKWSISHWWVVDKSYARFDGCELSCPCSYRCERNVEAYLDFSIEKEDVACHEEWIWLDADKGTSSSSYVSVDSGCATCSVVNVDELRDDCVCGRSNEGEQEGMEHEPEPVLSITEARCFQKWYFVCVQHRRVWWAALCELVIDAILCLKHMILTKQLSNGDLGGGDTICTPGLK